MDALRRPGTPCSACRKLASNLARLGQLAHHSRRYRFGDRQSGKLASFCGKFANDTQTAGPHQVVMVRVGPTLMYFNLARTADFRAEQDPSRNAPTRKITAPIGVLTVNAFTADRI